MVGEWKKPRKNNGIVTDHRLSVMAFTDADDHVCRALRLMIIFRLFWFVLLLLHIFIVFFFSLLSFTFLKVFSSCIEKVCSFWTFLPFNQCPDYDAALSDEIEKFKFIMKEKNNLLFNVRSNPRFGVWQRVRLPFHSVLGTRGRKATQLVV